MATDLASHLARLIGTTPEVVEQTALALYGHGVAVEYVARYGEQPTTVRALCEELAAGSGVRAEPVERAPRDPWRLTW